jgi:hypothetical protein
VQEAVVVADEPLPLWATETKAVDVITTAVLRLAVLEE